MSDDYRDLVKRDRLGDPSPRLPVCSACRGMTRVRGERCPECAGAGTLEGQTAHLAMLAECNANEELRMSRLRLARAEDRSLKPLADAAEEALADSLRPHMDAAIEAAEGERTPIVTPAWKESLAAYLWNDPDGELAELRAFLVEHKLELHKLPTFAELMAEGRSMFSSNRDTPEHRQRVTEALERECLDVVEGDASGFAGLVSDAVAKVKASAPLEGRLVVFSANPSTWTALGSPSAIMGYHCNLHGSTSDGVLVVTASKEGDGLDPSRIVLVKLHGELGKVAELMKTEPPQDCPDTTAISCDCGATVTPNHPGTTDMACACCGLLWQRNLQGRWHTVVPVPAEDRKPSDEWKRHGGGKGSHINRLDPSGLMFRAANALDDGRWEVRLRGDDDWACGEATDLRSGQLAAEDAMAGLEVITISSDPEFILAARGSGDDWGRDRDELKCICGARWAAPRVGFERKDCVCGRHLRKVFVDERGSKWAVNP